MVSLVEMRPLRLRTLCSSHVSRQDSKEGSVSGQVRLAQPEVQESMALLPAEASLF